MDKNNDQARDIRIDDLELSVRSTNGLILSDIKTLGQLLNYVEYDPLKARQKLRQIPRLGVRSVNEIMEVLTAWLPEAEGSPDDRPRQGNQPPQATHAASSDDPLVSWALSHRSLVESLMKGEATVVPKDQPQTASTLDVDRVIRDNWPVAPRHLRMARRGRRR